jgi:hypothetical protein
MDPFGFGKIIADKWDVLMMSPGAFIAVLGFGFFLGLAVVRAFLNERITRQQMRIVDLEKVLDGKLSASFLRPPIRKRSKTMSVGLGLIFGGLGASFVGAVLVLSDRSPSESTPSKIESGAAAAEPQPSPAPAPAVDRNANKDSSQLGSPPAILPAINPANAEEIQRLSLLKTRGELELSVRDAGGTPLKHQFAVQGIEFLEIPYDNTVYKISSHIAHGTAVWINLGMGDTKNLYVSKSAERGKPVDIRRLRVSKGSDTISIGQRAFIELKDGKILQLLLVGVLWYRGGDDVDEARFKYQIYDAGEFLIDAL